MWGQKKYKQNFNESNMEVSPPNTVKFYNQFSIKYTILRFFSCPIPFLVNNVPIIGGKTAIEIVLILFALIFIIYIGLTIDGLTMGSVTDYIFATVVCLSIRNYVLTLFFNISVIPVKL